jgi:hypothetical protein
MVGTEIQFKKKKRILHTDVTLASLAFGVMDGFSRLYRKEVF